MNNIISLQKDKDGNIYCQQITQKGIDYVNDESIIDCEYWEEGGTILLDEIEEILNKEV